MLGESDNLASVALVLDRLSSELENNKNSLDSACNNADELSHDLEEFNLVNFETSEKLTTQIRQENTNCEALRIALEDTIRDVSSVAQLVRITNSIYSSQELEIHKIAQRELLMWQTEVEKISDQCLQLRSCEQKIDIALAKLFADLKTKSDPLTSLNPCQK